MSFSCEIIPVGGMGHSDKFISYDLLSSPINSPFSAMLMQVSRLPAFPFLSKSEDAECSRDQSDRLGFFCFDLVI